MHGHENKMDKRTISAEDNLTVNWPQQKMTSPGYGLTERTPHRKMTTLDENITGRCALPSIHPSIRGLFEMLVPLAPNCE